MNTNFNLIIKRIINNDFFYPLVMILALSLALSKYYSDGSLILGGEGNTVLNFTEHLKITSYQWFSIYGQGMINLAPSGTGVNILLLALFENLTKSTVATNFILILSLYYLPFLGMFLAAREINLNNFSAFLIALFYLINPSTLQYLTNLNQWNASVVALMPFLFWIILKFYKDNLKLFLFYGTTTAIFSCAYSNQPLNAIANISSLISLFIISFHLNGKLIYSEILKKYMLLLPAFVLFNSWWLLNLFYSAVDAIKFYPEAQAQSWLSQVSNNTATPLFKCLTFTMLTYDYGYDFIGNLHNSFPGHIIKLIPITLVVLVCFFSKKIRKVKIIIPVFFLVLVAMFLTKGVSPPFGEIYLFLFKNIPLFNMFKTPTEKFGLLYIFLFTLLLLFIFLNIKALKEKNIFQLIFSGYLIFCFTPIATGNIIPDHNIGHYGKSVRKYVEKSEETSFKATINREKLNYKIMSLPGMGNYQILMKTGRKSYYTGWDPLLWTNKGSVQPAFSSHITEFYWLLDKAPVKKLFGMLNIGKLVVNPNLIPWFGNVGSGNPDTIRDRLELLPEKRYGNISVFNNYKNFLPVVYSPKNIFIVRDTVQTID